MVAEKELTLIRLQGESVAGHYCGVLLYHALIALFKHPHS